MVMSKFRVDSYQTLPMHYHFLSQENLLSEYPSQFIWLFYASITQFDLYWHSCNHFGMTLDTSYDELYGNINYGLHLIPEKERKDIDKMIMESTVLPSYEKKGLDNDV